MPSRSLTVDIAIIGAGPTGLFGAYYAGFRGRSVAVIDALPEIGGQVTAMYPEKKIHDVAGFPAVTGRELIERLHAQAEPMSPTYVLGERVAELATVESADHPLRLTTDAGTRIEAAAVILAGGVGAFRPRPLPPVPGVTTAEVAYFVSDLDSYRDQDVVIVGGGDSAFDWALALSGISSTVTLVHRRSTFRAHEFTVETARNKGVTILTDAVVSAGRRNYDGGLVGLDVRRAGAEQGSVSVPCQRIVAALGFTAQLGPILTWSLDIVDHRKVHVSSAMRTSRPRVFAAGDLTSYDGKVPLIAVGFGEAATAINNACQAISPAESVFPGHSTDVPTPRGA